MKPGRQVLRIIGGDWRGRRLRFPAEADLRPTADRVRETLFNWLAFDIPGARVLDLFAGSGALGLEALSRGAAEAVFVERNPAVAAVLRENLATLGATGRAEIVVGDATGPLAGIASPFDIVFLDPPFRSDMIGPVCEALAKGGRLAPGALVYIEYDRRRGEPRLPPGWEVRRRKAAGGVGYALACPDQPS